VQLLHIKVRFFSLGGPAAVGGKGKVLPYDDIEVLKKPFELISETAQTVMRFTADKLVYIDFNDLIFANLYISKDPKDTQSKNSP
jgi:hypothetical protein